MNYLENLLQALKSYTMPQTAEELKEEVQKEAMRRFYETLEMLNNRDAHSEEDIATAILINAMLMPRKYLLQAEDYRSEYGIAKLAQMKQLLDASKED